MEFQLWMLLIFPLFFGMGWLAARMDIKELLSESSALPQSYFQGLKFLLNEQQDKAIEAFIEVVKVDPQTVELHFALGSLLAFVIIQINSIYQVVMHTQRTVNFATAAEQAT